MYVEASSPRRQGDKSRMSKQYSGLSSTGNCLTFWYHMFGSHIGRLNVYVKQSASDALPNKAAWAMIGRQGNQWVKGQLTVANASAVVSGFLAFAYNKNPYIRTLNFKSKAAVGSYFHDYELKYQAVRYGGPQLSQQQQIAHIKIK